MLGVTKTVFIVHIFQSLYNKSCELYFEMEVPLEKRLTYLCLRFKYTNFLSHYILICTDFKM